MHAQTNRPMPAIFFTGSIKITLGNTQAGQTQTDRQDNACNLLQGVTSRQGKTWVSTGVAYPNNDCLLLKAEAFTEGHMEHKSV